MVPARAGMSPVLSDTVRVALSGPRASGDEPWAANQRSIGIEWSPRERG